MREISLTQGYVALVDDEDYEWLSKHKWCVCVARGGPAAVRYIGGGRRNMKHVYMHREITNAPSDKEVDHKDHCTLNNQRENLRVCTSTQNHANSIKRIGCSSRFKGVSWHKKAGKWRARVVKGGKETHLGLFADEVVAAHAYNAAALKHFGEFALLNDLYQGGLHA